MALFTGLFMCIMPQSMAYDTWIKSDNLASLFGYLALALLLRKRTLLAGISLGISLLSKENGAFFLITAVLCAPFLFEKNKLKGFLLLLTPCAIISGWWYVFFSNSSSNIVDFYFSKKIYGDIWSKPAWFYLAKLYNDIGPAGMIFFASGLSLSFIDALRKKYGVFPLTGLFLITYTFISVVFTTKTPWLSLSAYPAIAMISGYGAARVLSVGRKKVLAALTVGALTCWAMAGAAAYSYASYHSATYPNGWPGAVNSKKLAEYLNFTLKKGEKFVITDFSYWKTPVCPVFFFYSANMPEKIVPMASAPEDVARALKAEKAAYFIAVGIKGNKDLDRLTSFFDSKFGPPVNVAWAKVWRVRDI
jgi:hypothetical protein